MSFRSAYTAKRPPLPSISEPGASARLLHKLSLSQASSAVRPIADLNDVAQRFTSDVTQGRAPTVGDWNKIAWCIWTTEPAVAENETALDIVLARVAQMQRKRPYRQLASVYLMEFAPDRPRIDRVAEVLRAFATKAGSPWDQLQVQYNFFGGTSPVVQMAGVALSKKLNVEGFVNAIGLSSSFADSGFAEFMHAAGLGLTRRAPITTVVDRLEELRRWCLKSDGTSFFPSWRKEMARTLVLPFDNRSIEKSDRDLIASFLVKQFGDPRTDRSRWIGLDDVANILKRWLTEQSLRQFFDVVDRIAPDNTWKFRRKFWLAYHTHGLIQNAWVVFGPDGAAEVHRSFGTDAPFGRFTGYGQKSIQKGHAVLLLDFGQCIVADWSYDGYCNIWPSNRAVKPPALNLPRYSSDDVRRPVPSNRTEANLTKNDIFAHNGSESYVWQNRVARRLQELTGVRIGQTDYSISSPWR